MSISRLYEIMRIKDPNITEVDNIIKSIIDSGFKEKLSKIYYPLYKVNQGPDFKEKTELINKLVELCAKITDWKIYGTSDVVYTISYDNMDVPENLDKIIKLLGDNHCSKADYYHNIGFSPMAYATYKRQLDILKLLLSYGVPPDTLEEGWQTALYWSLDFYDHSYMKKYAEILIEAGANKFIENERDIKNLLHVVVSNCDDRDLHIVKIFIDCINISLKDCKGQTPIHISTKNCDHFILNDHSQNMSGTRQEECANVEIIKALLNEGTCTPDLINARDSYGWTALEIALINGCDDIAVQLIFHGATLDGCTSKGSNDNDINCQFRYVSQLIVEQKE